MSDRERWAWRPQAGRSRRWWSGLEVFNVRQPDRRSWRPQEGPQYEPPEARLAVAEVSQTANDP
jgi:hypothetical protein